MHTKLNMLGIPTNSIVKAIIKAKELYGEEQTTFYIDQIYDLTQTNIENTSNVVAKYTWFYLIQNIIQANNKNLDDAYNKALIHVKRFELEHASETKQRVSKMVKVLNRTVKIKPDGTMSKLDMAYNIVVENKNQTRDYIINVLMNTLNIQKNNAIVYLSKVTSKI